MSAGIWENSGHRAPLTGLGCIHEYLRLFKPKAMGDPLDTENDTELMTDMRGDSKYSRNRFCCTGPSLLHRGPLQNTEVREGGDGGDGGDGRGTAKRVYQYGAGAEVLQGLYTCQMR